jgi:hypothetical protein
MFKVKYGLNRMHSTIFAHQVGWFDGKGVDIHPWGLRNKPHSYIVTINDGMLNVCTLHN